jgi:hypothetical protein
VNDALAVNVLQTGNAVLNNQYHRLFVEAMIWLFEHFGVKLASLGILQAKVNVGVVLEVIEQLYDVLVIQRVHDFDLVTELSSHASALDYLLLNLLQGHFFLCCLVNHVINLSKGTFLPKTIQYKKH